MINRSYLQQVAMIESECDTRKKQPMIGNYTKSPLRDRENRMNLGNTPGRIGTKASLSPLRSRRTESSMASRVNFSRQRGGEPTCINDPHKTAKFFASIQEQTFYYCQKCAVLLASQGFYVKKLSVGQSMEINPRKQEVDSFLLDLEGVMGVLSKKQQMLSNSIESVFQGFQEEEALVEEYYGHFYEIIDQHKRRVLEQLKEEYETSIKQTSQTVSKLEAAKTDSKRMKDDIIESMNIILHESDEEQFRPIMTNYQMKLKEYKGFGSKVENEVINMRKLEFKDPEKACKALDEGLQIHWEGKTSMVDSKQSDVPENPVELIEVDEKFTKSSLKDIGTLFSSFDE